jgi:hypothetical protein
MLGDAIRGVHGHIHKIEMVHDYDHQGYRVYLVLNLDAQDELDVYSRIAPILYATEKKEV